MKAMVLAAGLGTRLRPLTNDRPKALVEIAGRTLLEIALTRLRDFGVRESIVNVHHFADKVVDYVREHDFGVKVEISREDDVLLDTGGGLKKAAWFFQGSDKPFFLHNVDVISDIDLGRMLESHARHGALATLAVQQREASRYLLFDENGELCGRRAGKDAPAEMAWPCSQPQALGFCGIHVISPRLLSMLTEDGVFPIIPPYLRLAAASEKILAFRADGYRWRDLGTPEHLVQAQQDFA